MGTDNESPLRLTSRCEHCGGEARAMEGELLRCACGSLLARYVGGQLELKCRRCKRTVAVTVSVAKGVIDGR